MENYDKPVAVLSVINLQNFATTSIQNLRDYGFENLDNREELVDDPLLIPNKSRFVSKIAIRAKDIRHISQADLNNEESEAILQVLRNEIAPFSITFMCGERADSIIVCDTNFNDIVNWWIKFGFKE